MDGLNPGETGADLPDRSTLSADNPEAPVKREGQFLAVRGPCDLGLREAARPRRQQAVDPAKVGDNPGVATFGTNEAQGVVA
jgi:hypothetical protein